MASTDVVAVEGGKCGGRKQILVVRVRSFNGAGGAELRHNA